MFLPTENAVRGKMKPPLEGIRVLDLTQWVFGPTTAAVLGDWGAEVIHLEDPSGGDPMRGLLSMAVISMSNINFPFELCNRNKKSLTVDTKQAKGQEIVHKLVEGADVFVSSLRKNVLERQRLDYATLSKINPRLVYAHVSGYGEKGGESNRAGYDFAAFWARTGLMASLGEPGTPPPPQRNGWGDQISGLSMAGGIALALFVRERTGIGQEVNLSLLGSGIWMAGCLIQGSLATGEDFPQLSRKSAGNPLFNTYGTEDGRWLQLVSLQTDRYWPGFCKAIEKPELEYDSRFDSHEMRCANNTILISIIDETLATRTLEEWAKRFDENGVLWGAVKNYLETASDQQAIENDYIAEVEHPARGRVKIVASPIQLSKTPAAIRTTAPELGQHTEEILLESGYTWDDISYFKNGNVIM